MRAGPFLASRSTRPGVAEIGQLAPQIPDSCRKHGPTVHAHACETPGRRLVVVGMAVHRYEVPGPALARCTQCPLIMQP